jgi:hypothetical protein
LFDVDEEIAETVVCLPPAWQYLFDVDQEIAETVVCPPITSMISVRTNEKLWKRWCAASPRWGFLLRIGRQIAETVVCGIGLSEGL